MASTNIFAISREVSQVFIQNNPISSIFAAFQLIVSGKKVVCLNKTGDNSRNNKIMLRWKFLGTFSVAIQPASRAFSIGRHRRHDNRRYSVIINIVFHIN
jgi:hypothetical protein